MDWHHPDGARCATDGAPPPFVDYVHGQIRELLTNYGKIDVLCTTWRGRRRQGLGVEKMTRWCSAPAEIIVTTEQAGWRLSPLRTENSGRGETRLESCMTMNDSWGYQKADDDWKSSKTIVRNLVTCAHGTGNYLLNMRDPRPDGRNIPRNRFRF